MPQLAFALLTLTTQFVAIFAALYVAIAVAPRVVTGDTGGAALPAGVSRSGDMRPQWYAYAGLGYGVLAWAVASGVALAVVWVPPESIDHRILITVGLAPLLLGLALFLLLGGGFVWRSIWTFTKHLKAVLAVTPFRERKTLHAILAESPNRPDAVGEFVKRHGAMPCAPNALLTSRLDRQFPKAGNGRFGPDMTYLIRYAMLALGVCFEENPAARDDRLYAGVVLLLCGLQTSALRRFLTANGIAGPTDLREIIDTEFVKWLLVRLCPIWEVAA